MSVLLANAAQVVRVCVDGAAHKTGRAMGEVHVVENASVLVQDGKIAWVGPAGECPATTASVIDCRGKCVVPGLVDAHTHPVWSGDRVEEFAMKLAGASYMEIHERGGGIGFSVRHTRESSEDELVSLLRPRLDRMLRAGTTLVECKSGYGLEADTELKMLRAVHRCSLEHPIDTVATFLGAHSVPKGKTAEEATSNVLDVQLPRLKAEIARGTISPELIDVFLEKGVFNKDQTRRILEAGKALGLEINFHGDELNYMAGGELAGELKALAVSHLEKISDEGIKGMLVRPSFAVLLPTTAYLLRLEPPPARRLIESGVPVALASDFNPNAHCLSMPAVMNLACVLMKMSMPEALVASTLNAAGSINRSATHGSIEVGKVGDFCIVDAPRWEHLVYQFADPPIWKVIKSGKVVWEQPRAHAAL